MTTITLDGTEYELTEADYDLVDALHQCIASFDWMSEDQTDEWYVVLNRIYDLFENTNAASIACAAGLLFDLHWKQDRVTIPGAARSQIELSFYLRGLRIKNADRWFKVISQASIKHRYGTDAALMYKLSDGAIDPRKEVAQWHAK